MESYVDYLLEEMIEEEEQKETIARNKIYLSEKNSFSRNRRKRNYLRDKRGFFYKQNKKEFWNSVPLFKKREEDKKEVMAILGKPFKNDLTEDQMIKQGLQDLQDQREDEARAEAEFWMEEEEAYFDDYWWLEFSDTQENERKKEERRLEDLYYKEIEEFDFIY